eukprot:CAMPEP_0118662172 /NCGR_PEP_ID=MMETSP0785-20121206/16677_1 /TAXON_ID=91992 /ORGANISM="Bolidomonas pacifica, Strain CCMP 1866" /LENGTH=117 /DNA_ID=CAMNT_0006555673 /DNA_START=97 /DNA_END=447 /DNA_ORIENTATION=+
MSVFLLFLILIIITPSSTPLKLTLPKSVKESVSNCRKSVQQSLTEKNSRMIVEFPTGTDFQLESKSSSSSKLRSLESPSPNAPPTTATIEKSNRELARVFVEMFQPLGSSSITVCFN